MNNYFEAVLVRVKDKPTVRALCRAPAFYGLEEGDEVVFKDADGFDVRGIVIQSCTMESNKEITAFMIQMFYKDIDSPFDLPKITKRIVTVNVKYYPEDEPEDENKEEEKHE